VLICEVWIPISTINNRHSAIVNLWLGPAGDAGPRGLDGTWKRHQTLHPSAKRKRCRRKPDAYGRLDFEFRASNFTAITSTKRYDEPCTPLECGSLIPLSLNTGSGTISQAGNQPDDFGQAGVDRKGKRRQVAALQGTQMRHQAFHLWASRECRRPKPDAFDRFKF
jgi:hypothetical protein